jgi:hypothetical protein
MYCRNFIAIVDLNDGWSQSVAPESTWVTVATPVVKYIVISEKIGRRGSILRNM